MVLKVLSLFDGISAAKVALSNLGIRHTYDAVEIDKYPRQIADYNWNDINRPSNDVTDFVPTKEYDLVIGGSPCQDLSQFNPNRKGLEGKKSGLFWEYVRILEAVRTINPNVKFVLENVRAPKKDQHTITETLNVRPVVINSCWFTRQNRLRYYWTNIDVRVSREMKTKRIINDGYTYGRRNSRKAKFNGREVHRLMSGGLCPTLDAGSMTRSHITFHRQQAKHPSFDINNSPIPIRAREALQGFPYGYTDNAPVSDAQKSIALGNSFTVPVIEFLLSFMEATYDL